MNAFDNNSNRDVKEELSDMMLKMSENGELFEKFVHLVKKINS